VEKISAAAAEPLLSANLVLHVVPLEFFTECVIISDVLLFFSFVYSSC
jgi:hypothetical protein